MAGLEIIHFVPNDTTSLEMLLIALVVRKMNIPRYIVLSQKRKSEDDTLQGT
jgi:hypothetical protein